MIRSNEVENFDVLTEFSDCHVGIVNMVNQIGELPNMVAYARQLNSILPGIERFFHDVVRSHHAEEEEQLFSAVLASASPGEESTNVQQMIVRLTAEHRKIESAFGVLIPEIRSLMKNPDAELSVNNLESLVEQYLEHARFEETDFLPLAHKILSRNSDHMAALGLSIHMRHDADHIRRVFGVI